MRHDSRLVYLSEPGIPGTVRAIPTSALDDPEALDKIIEESALCENDSVRIYHGTTRGWIASGILRRVDPQHRTMGQFIKEEISEPLGVKYFCGIPEKEQ